MEKKKKNKKIYILRIYLSNIEKKIGNKLNWQINQETKYM